VNRYAFAAHVPSGVDPVVPGPGQESVWDYPRPPRVEASAERVRVVAADETIAESTRAQRVLETAGAPVYYLAPDDVRTDLLVRSATSTICEWKGPASYWSLALPDGTVIKDVAWAYERPNRGYEAIAGHLAFYVAKVDEAWVDDERARPQEGGFYGGWVTTRIMGPIKGGPGSWGW
jgi:uncharacterized protein (DUF427 family)